MHATLRSRTAAPAARVPLWRVLAGVLALGAALAPAHPQDALPALPDRLSDTGLYVSGSTTQVRPGVLAYTPQYPLWSDGADKRRWIELPAGTSIDASQPDAWQFPPGTRLWKEFSHAGRRIETRTIERLRDGSWRYATYVWNDDGTEALLAPARGVAAWAVAQAPGGRYAVPSRSDCTGCHEGAAQPVLGFGALQLSPDRDPLAPHSAVEATRGVDLAQLLARGWLRNAPPAWLEQAPRIAARSPTERAALGYLHANCGHCHNRGDAGVPVRLTLAQSAIAPAASSAETLASALGATGRFRTPAWPAAAHLIEPGQPERSTLVLRMRSRDARLQMPALGTHIADDEGLALVERWIRQDLSTHLKEPPP